MGIYLHYRHLLRKARRGQITTTSNKRIYFLLREDILKLDRVSEQTRLLCANRIETGTQLLEYQEDRRKAIDRLQDERRALRKTMQADGADVDSLAERICDISAAITKERRNLKIAGEIMERSEEIREKLLQSREAEKPAERKEADRDVILRRGR
jgi:hypothetical protein